MVSIALLLARASPNGMEKTLEELAQRVRNCAQPLSGRVNRVEPGDDSS